MGNTQSNNAKYWTPNEYKIVVVGTSGVGRSSLTLRFVRNAWFPRFEPTFDDVHRKVIDIDSRRCILEIYDTSIEVDDLQPPGWFKKELSIAEGFVIVYSINSATSFDTAAQYRDMLAPLKVPMILVGNKCDLENERMIATEEGSRTAANWEIGFIEASAKGNVNVKEVYTELIHLIDKWRETHKHLKRVEKEVFKK